MDSRELVDKIGEALANSENSEQVISLLQEFGIELNDEDLDAIAGGLMGGGSVPIKVTPKRPDVFLVLGDEEMRELSLRLESIV